MLLWAGLGAAIQERTPPTRFARPCKKQESRLWLTHAPTACGTRLRLWWVQEGNSPETPKLLEMRSTIMHLQDIRAPSTGRSGDCLLAKELLQRQGFTVN